MNILFVEDEKDLSDIGVLQLETCGHTVYPVYNISEARQAMENADIHVQAVIADHRLPDGRGIDFIAEHKEKHPECVHAIVSGVLTYEDKVFLDEKKIPFFEKPLLYRNVVDHLLKLRMLSAPTQLKTTQNPEEEKKEKEEDTTEAESKKTKNSSGLFARLKRIFRKK